MYLERGNSYLDRNFLVLAQFSAEKKWVIRISGEIRHEQDDVLDSRIQAGPGTARPTKGGQMTLAGGGG